MWLLLIKIDVRVYMCIYVFYTRGKGHKYLRFSFEIYENTYINIK